MWPIESLTCSARPAVFVLLTLFCAPVARADDAYYVLIFGSQSEPKRPRLTHTWATFVRAADQPIALNAPIESFTISWMPASLAVRPLALRPESGTNLGLHETLRAMYASGEGVSLWGPYRVSRELYERAATHKIRLESGQLAYKAVDSRRPSPSVSNCMHAVCDALGIPRGTVREEQVQGKAASASIAASLLAGRQGAIVPEGGDWLLQRLGLSGYAITRR
jgi:hypothetical protein